MRATRSRHRLGPYLRRSPLRPYRSAGLVRPHTQTCDSFQRGFTLIEIMISLAIVATLAAIAVPNYISYVEKARVARAISEVKNIEKAVMSYYVDNEAFPDTLSQVGFGGYADPWGNGYRYLRIDGGPPGNGKKRKDHSLVPVNSDFDLYSMGPDGKSSSPFTAGPSKDDIVRANNGGYVGLVSNY